MSLSKSAQFYRNNKKSREKKKAYDTSYHKTPARRKYRSKLWMERRKRGIAGKGGGDLSHTRNGGLVRENSSTNRARNGADGKSTKK